jgi:hypothetical protein
MCECLGIYVKKSSSTRTTDPFPYFSFLTVHTVSILKNRREKEHKQLIVHFFCQIFAFLKKGS